MEFSMFFKECFLSVKEENQIFKVKKNIPNNNKKKY